MRLVRIALLSTAAAQTVVACLHVKPTLVLLVPAVRDSVLRVARPQVPKHRGVHQGQPLRRGEGTLVRVCVAETRKAET